MALLERAIGLQLLRRRTQHEPSFAVSTQEAAPNPQFSEQFLRAQAEQTAIDTRFANLTPTGPREGGMFGQDKLVSKVPTTEGTVVVKKLKETSRFNLIYGMGFPAASIPPDTDTTGKREQMATMSIKQADPEEVAEKIRLTHIMATTYLGEGGLIVPTATMVGPEGDIEQVQKFLPTLGTVIDIPKDPREVQIEANTKVELFRTLKERHRAMLSTSDFRALPPDVQDYWRTFPPDSGFGTNAHFLGFGKAVAIDY